MQDGGRSQEAAYVWRRSPRQDPHERLKHALAKVSAETEVSERYHGLVTAFNVIDNCIDEFVVAQQEREISRIIEYIGSAPTPELLSTSLVLDCPSLLDILRSQEEWRTVTIHSKECPNTNSAMKLIVKRLTGDEKVDLSVDMRLAYDFDVLVDWLHQNSKVKRVVVYLEDTDSFDAGTLRELMGKLHSYADRLPLHLVLQLSMPPILLEDNLSREIIMGMRSIYFCGSPNTALFVQRCAEKLRESGTPLGNIPQVVDEQSTQDAGRFIRYACLAYHCSRPLNPLEIVPRLPSVRKLQPDLVEDPEGAARKWEEQKSHPNPNDILGELVVQTEMLHDVFNPTFRALLESTLAVPPSSSVEEIPLSLLYQLVREAPMYVNIYDWFVAFKTMLVTGQGAMNDRHILSLFLEGAASLKFLGIVRDCKRKFESVEKVAWKGV